MNKSVIVIVGGFRLPDGNASAVRARGHIALLRAMDYDVVLVGKIDPKHAMDNQKWYRFFDTECLDITQCESNFTKGIRYVDEINQKYNLTSIKAIIAYNYPSFALNKLHQWCLKNKIFLISDTTEWYAFEGKNIILAMLRKLSTEYRMRIVNRKIGNIICSTYYICKYYGEKYNTVIIPMIAANTKEDNCIDFQANNPRKFIYAGSPGLNFSKDDIETIVKAFLNINDEYQLSFYGFTKESFLNAYPKYHKTLKQNKKINFYGRVDKQAVDLALSESDFYVLYRPNTKVNKVGFSTKSMEAISAQVPLIANDVNGDFGIYFNQNQAFISAANDYDEFVKNIQKAICMPDEDVIKMKKNCERNNPFVVAKYIKPMFEFIERLR